jgi:predicted transposase YdaD
MIDLPEDMNDKLWQEMRQYEQESDMRFVNSAERYGIKKGLEKGITKGRREGRREQAVETVLLLATHKLGQVDQETVKRLKSLPLTRLKKLTVDLLDFAEQEDLLAWLRQQPLSRG